MGRRKWFGSADNILNFFRKAVDPSHLDEGRDWYRQAQREAAAMAMTFGVEIHTVAGMLSAYSANNTWANNRLAVYTTLRRWRDGDERPVRGLTTVVNMVEPMLAGAHPMDVIRGLKLRDFYRAILTGGHHPLPVIDRWMARVWMDLPDWNLSVTPAMYRDAQSAYLEVAEALNIHPSDLQAGVWVAVRGTGA